MKYLESCYWIPLITCHRIQFPRSTELLLARSIPLEGKTRFDTPITRGFQHMSASPFVQSKSCLLWICFVSDPISETTFYFSFVSANAAKEKNTVHTQKGRRCICFFIWTRQGFINTWGHIITRGDSPPPPSLRHSDVTMTFTALKLPSSRHKISWSRAISGGCLIWWLAGRIGGSLRTCLLQTSIRFMSKFFIAERENTRYVFPGIKTTETPQVQPRVQRQMLSFSNSHKSSISCVRGSRKHTSRKNIRKYMVQRRAEIVVLFDQ